MDKPLPFSAAEDGAGTGWMKTGWMKLVLQDHDVLELCVLASIVFNSNVILGY